MTASMLCVACRPPSGPLAEAIGIHNLQPTHCFGSSDRPASPGVLGGFRCSCDCRFNPPDSGRTEGDRG